MSISEAQYAALFQATAVKQGLVIEEHPDPKGFPGTVVIHTRKARDGETPRYIPLPQG